MDLVVFPDAERRFHLIRICAVRCRVFVLTLLAATLPGALCADTQPQGNASVGRQLFVGSRPLQNGGPACAACHSIAGIPFPNGGTLGPDLTGAFTKLGAQGIGPTMQTLFFPTMAPIFDPRPLTPAEQQDLRAFLQEAAAQRTTPAPATAILGLIALGGFLVLVAAAWVVWRNRLRPVRVGLLVNAGTSA